MTRKSHEDAEHEDVNMLKPITIEDFGSENDPCFGKLYDLKAPECRRCGDSVICSAVMAQLQNVQRSKLEDKQPFKDVLEPLTDKEQRIKIRSYIRKKIKAGYNTVTIIKLLKKKYAIPKPDAKKLITKILNKTTK